MKTLSGFALILLLSTYGCKKETEAPPGPPAVKVDREMNLITASEWIIYKAEVSGINVWDLLIEACQKDDTYRFYADSTLTTYENTTVCSGNADSTQSFWSFYDGRKKLIGTVLGLSDTAEILTLTETDMKLNVDYDGSPALIYFRKP